MTNLFNIYSQYYDLLYSDKDYVEETNYITSVLSRHSIEKGNLLELGCGTGKHGTLLANMGYKVLGIERSQEMLSQVVPVSGFTTQKGDITSISLDQSFDAIYSLFHVISYQTSNESLLATFNKAAEHLEINGFFIFDFWLCQAVCSQQPVIRVKRMENDIVEITRIAEPEHYTTENRVDVNYTFYVRNKQSDKIDVIRETHPMRYFSIPELELIASLSGFQLINSEEFLTGKQLDEHTWSGCVVWKKVKNND